MLFLISATFEKNHFGDTKAVAVVKDKQTGEKITLNCEVKCYDIEVYDYNINEGSTKDLGEGLAETCTSISSSNPKIVSVDGKKITAHDLGNVVITGYNGYCTIKINITVKGEYLKTKGTYNEALSNSVYDALKDEFTRNEIYFPDPDQIPFLLETADRWYKGEITTYRAKHLMRYTKFNLPEGAWGHNMVRERKLAVPDPKLEISQLSKGTQDLIELDYMEYAHEQWIRVERDPVTYKPIALSGRFCDIEEIYRFTRLEFCEEGEDVAAYKQSIARTITLELPDKEFDDLCRKAGSGGLKVSELLENFVHDLVGGSYTNGSDERMYADQWFDRCWFGMEFSKNFLGYLVEMEEVENVIDTWEDLKLYEDIEEPDADDLEEIECFKETLDSVYGEYKVWYKDATGTFEEDMKDVLEWWEDVQRIQ